MASKLVAVMPSMVHSRLPANYTGVPDCSATTIQVMCVSSGYESLAMRPSPFMLNQFQQLTTADKVLLLQLARSSIGELWQPELQDAILQIRSQLLSLDQSFACFVTIHLDGKLRGCIGTLQATRPLLDAICYYAKAAACQDPRLPPTAPC